MMFENIEEEAYKLLNEFKRVTPALLMRRFKLNCDFAQKLCEKIIRRQNLEARNLAKRIVND